MLYSLNRRPVRRNRKVRLGNVTSYATAFMIPDNNTVNTCPALGGGLRAKASAELHIAADDDKGAELEVIGLHR
jgi:hypothetical protein